MTTSDELAQKLLDLDEDMLKAQLGIIAQEIEREPTARSASLESLDEAISATPRGGTPDRADVSFGDRYFKSLNVKSYNMMCSDLFEDLELKAKFQASFKENSELALKSFAIHISSNIYCCASRSSSSSSYGNRSAGRNDNQPRWGEFD